jgi:hypothetical protein
MQSSQVTGNKQPKARLIAFYLPQYYPIPENDEWWGKGFTEWTNVARAKPLFRGHYQPRIPADLGFYDLRVPETRQAQADMAKAYGIEAFCYWHYWFGGKRILERQVDEMLSTKQPDFPFCLGWANQSWTGIWHGASDRILIEQTYPGMNDHIAHFYTLLPAFTDDRYIKIDEKPVFIVYRPLEIPESKKMTDLWRELAFKEGLKGLYLIGEASRHELWIPQDYGFDGSFRMTVAPPADWFSRKHPLRCLRLLWERRVRRLPLVCKYEEVLPFLDSYNTNGTENFPCILANWDNTPRSGRKGLVLHESTPELFRIHVRRQFNIALEKPEEYRIVFIKSWNEWAEGNYLEPDLQFGHAYLKVLFEEVCR